MTVHTTIISMGESMMRACNTILSNFLVSSLNINALNDICPTVLNKLYEAC